MLSIVAVVVPVFLTVKLIFQPPLVVSAYAEVISSFSNLVNIPVNPSHPECYSYSYSYCYCYYYYCSDYWADSIPIF